MSVGLAEFLHSKPIPGTRCVPKVSHNPDCLCALPGGGGGGSRSMEGPSTCSQREGWVVADTALCRELLFISCYRANTSITQTPRDQEHPILTPLWRLQLCLPASTSGPSGVSVEGWNGSPSMAPDCVFFKSLSLLGKDGWKHDSQPRRASRI